MCENLNIDVRHTAAYSPWQNGLCERNHAVVNSSVKKMLDDNPSLSLEVALIWGIHAKNCLQMNSGYSSYQLIFGRNPNLPNVFIDGPPALSGATASKSFAKHLNALHSARQSYTKAETSERIRRALRHQIRVKDQVFETGDPVYYQRDGQNKWRGPGKVIGQDGKVVFVRHGSIYVRVTPCRLIKKGEEFNNESADEEENSNDIETRNSDTVIERQERDLGVERRDRDPELEGQNIGDKGNIANFEVSNE